MFGFDNMLKEMLGMDVEEMKAQFKTAAEQGQQIVHTIMQQNQTILNNQVALHHRQLRIEKMVESILRERGIEIPAELVEPKSGSRQLPN